ncbi:Glyceraldehyde 3-phosphate phosphatase [Candidatus Lokiarchaeum ossiferum]|uniref:Glyceraldehyde 3-phosphate phosphatase n=1 Tax=Candidatus Lokiarchaeum ossiferum TaxID=2951803 RepID=A0ABY6HU12_9ARCH|nr:Glyceraldehyde 3-phosphate phosphatase [Candidatus Lokiarchaeum sp. B-35]
MQNPEWLKLIKVFSFDLGDTLFEYLGNTQTSYDRENQILLESMEKHGYHIADIPKFLDIYQKTIKSNYLALLKEGKDTKYMYVVLRKVFQIMGWTVPNVPTLVDIIRPANLHRFSTSNFKPFHYLHSLLELLQKNGRKMILISNIPESSGPGEPKFADEILKRNHIFDFFSYIILSGELEISKPNPAIFNQALHLTGVKPSQIVHIGDSYEMDVVGAASIGMRTIWLTNGHELKKNPITRTPDLEFPSINEFYEFLNLSD